MDDSTNDDSLLSEDGDKEKDGKTDEDIGKNDLLCKTYYTNNLTMAIDCREK